MATVYPSIYRAKADQVHGTSMIVFVPQVFGDQPITVTETLSPREPGMGWVFFQAGDPDFPVWTSDTTPLEARVAALEAAVEALS